MAHLSDPHPPRHVDVHVKGKHKHKHHKVKKPKVKVHKDKVCKTLSLSVHICSLTNRNALEQIQQCALSSLTSMHYHVRSAVLPSFCYGQPRMHC